MGLSTDQISNRPSWLRRLFGEEAAKPRVPDGRRVYAVGDVHGRRDLLDDLIEQIRSHAATAQSAQNVLVMLGDYVDRGKDSKGVIDTLLGLELPGWQKVFLRGNHDQAILDFLNDAQFYRAWRNFGAADTLLSYGVMPPRFENDAAIAKARDEFAEKLPVGHLNLISSLNYLHTEGDYLFVHAGIRPGIALDQQAPEDMLGIRDDFLLSQRSFGKVVVHGHTPTDGPVKRRNRIGIDTGAFFSGRLTAAILEGDSCVFVGTGQAARMSA